jgi:hypothetical protein
MYKQNVRTDDTKEEDEDEGFYRRDPLERAFVAVWDYGKAFQLTLG